MGPSCRGSGGKAVEAEAVMGCGKGNGTGSGRGCGGAVVEVVVGHW